MSDNKKHPLESVVEALEQCIYNLDPYEYNLTEYKKALTTLREYIANDERVEGLAEAISWVDDVHSTGRSDFINTASPYFLTLLEAARLQLKRQEG